MHYVLFYEAAGDYIARRAQFRDAHLRLAWAASERGELILGGALANPVDGALLLFSGDSPEVAEKFARADPYVTSGIVKRWHVREWNTVVGKDAATPVRPGPEPSPGPRTILRMWRGRPLPGKVDDYVQHVTRKVFPALQAIDGYRGAYLLRRALDGDIEFVVLTVWDSMAAVAEFAGAEPDQAVVEPEARAVLASFDELVTHFQVVHSDGRVM